MRVHFPIAHAYSHKGSLNSTRKSFHKMSLEYEASHNVGGINDDSVFFDPFYNL
jgi:hypothetical protein